MPELQATLSRAGYHRAHGGASPALVAQKVAPVQQFSLFSNLSVADCAEIVSAGHEKQFSRKQIIFLEGDPCAQIWLLLSGCAKVTQIGQNGTEVILRVSGPGDVLGALQCSPVSRQCCTVQALEACLVLFWDTRFFEAVSARVPVLGRNVAHILQERLKVMEERFREISTEKVASRLSSELVRLAQHIGQRKIEGIEISISQQELAQLTGTTLFTVSRLLCQWGQLGVVKTRREAVSICNLQELASISVTE